MHVRSVCKAPSKARRSMAWLVVGNEVPSVVVTFHDGLGCFSLPTGNVRARVSIPRIVQLFVRWCDFLCPEKEMRRPSACKQPKILSPRFTKVHRCTVVLRNTSASTGTYRTTKSHGVEPNTYTLASLRAPSQPLARLRPFLLVLRSHAPRASPPPSSLSTALGTCATRVASTSRGGSHSLERRNSLDTWDVSTGVAVADVFGRTEATMRGKLEFDGRVNGSTRSKKARGTKEETRAELLERVRQDRAQRQAGRAREQAAWTIQKHVRRIAKTREERKRMWKEWDVWRETWTSQRAAEELRTKYVPLMLLLFRKRNQSSSPEKMFLCMYNQQEVARLRGGMALIIKSAMDTNPTGNYFSYAEHQDPNVREPWKYQLRRLVQLGVMALEFSCKEGKKPDGLVQAGSVRLIEILTHANSWNCFSTVSSQAAATEQLCLQQLGLRTRLYPIAGHLVREQALGAKDANQHALEGVLRLSLRPLLRLSGEEKRAIAIRFLEEVLTTASLVTHLPAGLIEVIANVELVDALLEAALSPDASFEKVHPKECLNWEGSTALSVAFNLINLFDKATKKNKAEIEPRIYLIYLQTLRKLFAQGVDDLRAADSKPEYEPVLLQVQPLLNRSWFQRFLAATHSSSYTEKVEAQDSFVLVACVYYSLIELLVICHGATGKEAVVAMIPALNVLAFTPGIQQSLWFQAAKMLRIPGEIPTAVASAAKIAVWDIEELHGGVRGITESGSLSAVFGLFCRTYNHLLLVLDDDDFFDRQEPFTIPQLQAITAALNTLVYRSIIRTEAPKWKHDHCEEAQFPSLLGDATTLLRSLYDRDCRRAFCPPDLWLAPADCGPHLGAESSGPRGKEIISQVLKTCPQTMRFEERASIFRETVIDAKLRHRPQPMPFFGQDMVVPITIHRGSELEDAYTHLLGLSTDRLRTRWMVSFVNEQGLEEAGLDGGGLLKELLTEVSKKGFDPRYGLFESNADGEIYPSPAAENVEHGLELLEVMGKMIGKAVFEGVLVEVSLANFFAANLLGRYSYLDSLPSFDKDLHRNLVRLKQYEGDAAELCLDFTIEEMVFGQRVVHELRPGGKDIPVTNENKLQYVHLVAHWKLNKSMGKVMGAFARGFYSVVEPQWLQMFSVKELTQLLSGGQFEVDLDDLRAHTKYSGGYQDGSRAIRMFWKVLSTFSSEEMQRFLRFVTSCPRPPLLGFKHLTPPFTIHKVVEDTTSLIQFSDLERLPTASTCNNMLKLPNYRKESTLRDKMLYAIGANAGFDLS